MKLCFALVKTPGAVSKYEKTRSPRFELRVEEGNGLGGKGEKYWKKQQGEVKVSIGFLFIPITVLLRVGFSSLGDRASLP